MRRKPIAPDLRELAKRVERARQFPENTCPASRHLHMIADHLARGEAYAMLSEEPQHCAATMLAVLASLWELRTKSGWGVVETKVASTDVAYEDA